MEAKIDLSSLNRTKQNIFSVGSDISVWSTGNDGKYNLHFYYPNATAHDQLLRFSAVIGQKVNGLTRRTKGIIKIPSELITIRIDKNGISIDGNYISRYEPDNLTALKNSGDEGNYKFITEDDKPAYTYEYLITNYFENVLDVENLQLGSMEGSTRTWAYYEYIMYHHEFN